MWTRHYNAVFGRCGTSTQGRTRRRGGADDAERLGPPTLSSAGGPGVRLLERSRRSRAYEFAIVNLSVPHADVTSRLFPSPLAYVDRQRHVPSSLATKAVFVVVYVPLPLSTVTVSEYAAAPEQLGSPG